jgi:hypothetical protein
LEVDDSKLDSRKWLFATGGGDAIAIRTPNWCLREKIGAVRDSAEQGLDSKDETSEPMLFVRPDDRWEANDVSKLCADVVEELEQLAGAAANSFVSTGPPRVPHP